MPGGRPPTGVIPRNVYLDPVHWEKLQELAGKAHLSRSSLIRYAVAYFLNDKAKLLARPGD